MGTILEEHVQKGIAIGRVEGRLEGRLEGQRATLVALLSTKFGSLPDAIRHRIDDATASELETWSLRVLTATAIDDIFAARS